MKLKIIPVCCLLLLGLAGCDTPQERSVPAEVEDGVSIVPDQMETEPVEPSTTLSGPTLLEFISAYPELELPVEFPWVDPDAGIIWMADPVAGGQLEYLCGADKIVCNTDEEVFHVGRFQRNATISVLITYIVGDFSERLVLSTHDLTGNMVAHEVINMVSEELNYGYASKLSKNFKISRAQMIYRVSKKTGKQVQYTDHKDIFMIEESGIISRP